MYGTPGGLDPTCQLFQYSVLLARVPGTACAPLHLTLKNYSCTERCAKQTVVLVGDRLSRQQTWPGPLRATGPGNVQDTKCDSILPDKQAEDRKSFSVIWRPCTCGIQSVSPRGACGVQVSDMSRVQHTCLGFTILFIILD